jgi:hypothetical protein
MQSVLLQDQTTLTDETSIVILLNLKMKYSFHCIVHVSPDNQDQNVMKAFCAVQAVALSPLPRKYLNIDAFS